jgi:hypothetical protein
MRFARGRLRAPLLLLVFGSMMAAVFAVAQGWRSGLATEATVLVGALAYYLASGRDDDMAALIRHDTDERQTSVKVRAQALAGRVVTAAIAIAFVIAVAVRAPVWPFAVLSVVAGGSFAVGLAIYG